MRPDTDRADAVATRGRVLRAKGVSARGARSPFRGRFAPGAPTADATACPRAGGTAVALLPRPAGHCTIGRMAAAVAESGPAVMDGARLRAETAPAA